MDTNFLAGLGLVLGAGIMNGSFAVPMKYARLWSWENIWLAWSFLALILFPTVLTLSTVPRLSEIYSSSPMTTLGAVLVFGAGWGISQVLFGLGIDRVGVAVGFAIVVGLAAAIGTLLPLLLFYPTKMLSSAGLTVMAGVVVSLGGVALCAWAGKKKEGKPDSGPEQKSSGLRSGILFCVLSGLGGSMINLGLVFGAPIVDQARRHGVSALHQGNAVWLPLLFCGFLTTSLYCCRLLQANRTWPRFLDRQRRSHWFLALLMAVLWFGSVEVYGIAVVRLGNWGPVLGWPVFMSSAIVTANVWGLLTAEWKDAPRDARRLMFTGITVLVAAIFVLGLAGRPG